MDLWTSSACAVVRRPLDGSSAVDPTVIGEQSSSFVSSNLVTVIQ
jgi:hypothetical protein